MFLRSFSRSLILMVGVFLTGFSVNAASFSDLSDAPYFETGIEYLAEQRVVNGYGDGRFGPWDELNRAEMVKILVEGVGIQDVEYSENCFVDVPAGAWFEPYVCIAEELGWVQGYADGTFRPAQPVNVVEGLKLVLEAFDFDYVVPRVDVVWYVPIVEEAADLNLISLTIDNFGDNLLRGEMADIVARARLLNVPNADLDEYLAEAWGEYADLVNDFESIALGLNAFIDRADYDTVLFAQVNGDQDPPPANPENLMRQYNLVALDPENEETEILAVLDTNFFNDDFGSFHQSEDDYWVYFHSASGEIYGFDLIDQELERLLIPDVIPTANFLDESTVSNFKVFGGRLFYLLGSCSDEYAEASCLLGEYRLADGSHRVVAANLLDDLETMDMSVVRIGRLLPRENKIEILQGAGDAGVAALNVSEVNLDSGEVELVDQVVANICSGDQCTQEMIEENLRYFELWEKHVQYAHSCTGVEAQRPTQYEEGVEPLWVETDDGVLSFDESYYVGCSF